MKYFLDTEFLEGKQRSDIKHKLLYFLSAVLFLNGINYFYQYTTISFDIVLGISRLFLGGISLIFSFALFLLSFKTKQKTPPTIDLISIGIVSEDSREYYAISKDFNVKEAWNRYDGYKTYTNLPNDTGTNKRKNYWIRENVLHQIHYDLLQIEKPFKKTFEQWKEDTCEGFYEGRKNYRALKRLIKKYGKSNSQIKNEILQFTLDPNGDGFDGWLGDSESYFGALKNSSMQKTEFYAYYADYDWVVFCWLFGSMINLPKGFPMYCIDLKQELDRKLSLKSNKMIGKIDAEGRTGAFKMKEKYSLKERIKIIKSLSKYPKQENQHNAIADARWNKKLYSFLEEVI